MLKYKRKIWEKKKKKNWKENFLLIFFFFFLALFFFFQQLTKMIFLSWLEVNRGPPLFNYIIVLSIFTTTVWRDLKIRGGKKYIKENSKRQPSTKKSTDQKKSSQIGKCLKQKEKKEKKKKKNTGKNAMVCARLPTRNRIRLVGKRGEIIRIFLCPRFFQPFRDNLSFCSVRGTRFSVLQVRVRGKKTCSPMHLRPLSAGDENLQRLRDTLLGKELLSPTAP